MRRMLPVVLLVSLLVCAGAALAMDQPMIQAPGQGDTLGPNYDISGSMPYKAFLVVITDCVDTATGDVLGSVPGIRHWTNEDGSFHFRCASPRVSFGEAGAPLAYRVRCFETRANGDHGPEAVVNCR
ncbi:MAG: hypothetical protein KKI08_20395 [Armatimonadetes bacterium]|nr:hypothetical protein [Armatimonadota bacterium]